MEVDRLVARLDADIGGFRSGLGEAARVLARTGGEMEQRLGRVDGAVTSLGEGLGKQAAQASALFGKAFDTVGRDVTRALSDLVLEGDFNFAKLASSISRHLARIGIETLARPLLGGAQSLFTNLLGGLIGRAAGGPVVPGTAYRVGERGPELFVPSTPGRVVPQGGSGAAPVVFNVQTPDAASFLRSEGQVTAMLARAVLRGRRSL